MLKETPQPQTPDNVDATFYPNMPTVSLSVCNKGTQVEKVNIYEVLIVLISSFNREKSKSIK